MSDPHPDLHPLIVMTAKRLATIEPVHGLLNATTSDCLDVAVGHGSVERALRLLDTVLKAAEAQGMVITVKLSPPDPYQYGRRDEPICHISTLSINEDAIAFRLEETTETVAIPPPLPPPPPKSRRWNYQPPSTAPTFEHRPTGRLSLRITRGQGRGMQSTWNDTTHRKLENFLNAFVATCLRLITSLRDQRLAEDRKRLAEEESKRRRAAAEAEAKRVRAEQERLQQAEQARIDDLEERLRSWHQSWTIRDFTEVVEADVKRCGKSLEPGSVAATWLAWARERAATLATHALESIGEKQFTPPPPPTEPPPSTQVETRPLPPDMPPKSYWETRHWWQKR